MRWTVFFLLIFPATHLPVCAQKLETQTRDFTAIKRIETVRDHLTVIEMNEPVTMVAVGSQNLFSIERRGSRVFVKPTEDGFQTNLFVWTDSGRYSYELVPAKGVAEMHFAIDKEAPPVAVSKVEKPALSAPSGLPTEMLTEGMPVAVYGERETDGRIEISIRDLYRKDHRLYLRYSLTNRSSRPYHAAPPAVWQLNGARAPQSLLGLSGTQLGERFTRSLKVAGQAPIPVIEADQTSNIDPGVRGIGWLIVDDPGSQGSEPTVLKLQFATDTKGELNTIIVLDQNTRGAPEVAHAREGAGESQH